MAKKRRIRRAKNGDVTINLKTVKLIMTVLISGFVLTSYLGIKVMTPGSQARAELSERVTEVEGKQKTTDATYENILTALTSIDTRLTNLENK